MKSQQHLEQRLTRLEKSNYMLLGILVLLLLAVVAGARSASPPTTIQATGFDLLDDHGTVRASLTMRNGAPVLSFIDSLSVERLLVTTNSDETAVFIKDSEGTTRLGMAQFSHGGGGFAAHGPDSKGAAVLYLKGRGSLSFYDTDGNLVASVPRADQ